MGRAGPGRFAALKAVQSVRQRHAVPKGNRDASGGNAQSLMHCGVDFFRVACGKMQHRAVKKIIFKWQIIVGRGQYFCTRTQNCRSLGPLFGA